MKQSPTIIKNSKRLTIVSIILLIIFSFKYNQDKNSWIRINQLGYTPGGIKVAVWVSKNAELPGDFQLIDATNSKVVFSASTGKSFGSYGPFTQSFRLNFSPYKNLGNYYLQCGSAVSPKFKIDKNIYDGAADFMLQYMRQQRSGFNPFLKDSCHTHDGYTMYGPMPDSTHIDVVGGWHDASDYLQYSTTSANATWHLLAAYRDFPGVFTDKKIASGLDGKNGIADVLDEAKWGLDWLLKMHPKPDWMFNQIADDRDHEGMRIPKEDSFYGKGYERPVYFINGLPQQRGKFMNQTTGTSSTAAKFAASFSLGAILFDKTNPGYAKKLITHAYTSINYALIKPGVTQTVSVKSPYIYAEDNWTDDMELGFASLANSQHYFKNSNLKKLLDSSFKYSQGEKITPWLYRDTANHYQYYPFINLGHYELAKQLSGSKKDSLISYYKQGIEDVWSKAKENVFYRGVPFIWCSNNLTTSFVIQCLWYRLLTRDNRFAELEQANIDWLFGCNPWGTSMVYGLPSWGDTPTDPHSAFTHLKNYPINGGLVDGPVYTTIYKNLIGITLHNADAYSQFQSDLAVYHDDFGDYSTNEPTMDGTASLIYLMAAKEEEAKDKSAKDNRIISHNGIIRGDTTSKKIALVFTGDEFADGGNFIAKALLQQHINGSFFLTGNFYRNPKLKSIVKKLKDNGNYLGSHSDKHLLYCDWIKRDSLLVTHLQFTEDLQNAYHELNQWNIDKKNAHYFLPPYEWYNDSIAIWAKQMGLQLVDFSPETRSNADYTYPEMGDKYVSSDVIMNSILQYELKSTNGLNGFILLVHIGTDPRRTDKFYYRLPALIQELKKRGYDFVKINQLLN
ncbi:polysaccharide deacetylase family protein [Ginsengibacter hankyongi]|uniref:Polysaccharide deacetylase family protein n=1 Tax=Ginsengibacter hankyongi TaxID=2607284 RepID=A0A5J5IGC9_9BACT|nr:glycoside hydrolase family 9 protein [Ginsengibacter hankyongi]KAA9039215.1 polysaccharide deacetylase family protein [Ginsengibacter hankyongi]